MEEPQSYIYELSPNREKEMWENGIFIFDSSALLDFYFLPQKTRNKIFALFSDKLKDRLWIPSHVKYEYNKNREKVITKPINENYKPIKEHNLKDIKNYIKEIENRINDLKNKTKKDDKHPYIPQDEIDVFLKKVSAFKTESETFEDSIIKRVIEVEEEIRKLPTNDDVAKAINDFFKVGRYYGFEETIEITKEGKHRYEFLIPPGYEDLKDKEKRGTQIFGDLIIWKQTIELAKELKKPIIFICNDLKEDWCHLEKNASEKRIESPREELIKEIYDFAKVDFWMYTQAQFLFKLNEYFNADIEKQNIDNLTEFLAAKSKPQKELVFDCDRCGKQHHYEKGELEMDFELVGSHVRNMGSENEYQATEFLNCDQCGNEINVTFSIWEYPIGAPNYYDIDIDGARLISSFDFSIDFHGEPEYESEPELDICAKCGKHFFDEEQIGICSECNEKYNQQ